MFAAQQHPFERKRGREEEELAANGMSFGEHRNVSSLTIMTTPDLLNHGNLTFAETTPVSSSPCISSNCTAMATPFVHANPEHGFS
jgi:hypothetical protein